MNAKHRLLTRLTLSAVALLTVVGMASAQIQDPRDMDFPKLNDIVTPEVKRVTLPN
ncbi:MAG: hypothetical protein HKN21_08490, partial [Candidatus Eisenbacteria bacterium]|nr:hypothetical protein [Candidatus Eisenbacteria bacterium]